MDNLSNLTSMKAATASARLRQDAQTLQKKQAMLAKTGAEGAKFKSELTKASEGFEELFVHKMLTVMRDSTEKSGLIDGGRGEEIFQDMLDEQYSKLITKSKALGLSQMIIEQTLKQ